MFERQKIILKLCRNVNETYHVLKTIKIKNLTQKIVKFGTHSFTLDQAKPTFRVNLSSFYYIDVDKNLQLFFYKNLEILNPEALDLIVSRRIIQNLSSSLKESNWLELKPLILGGTVGASIALVVMLILMQLGVL